MAFEEELGHDPSQPIDMDYTLGASGIISKTISLWTRNIVGYLAVTGFIAAACTIVSYVILVLMFNTVGTLGADPISYLISLFFFSEEFSLLAASLGFAIFAFILNAIINGAAIKFTLDEYGGTGGNVSASFSHSRKRVLNFILVQLILTFIAAIIIIPVSVYSLEAITMIDMSDPLNPIFPPGSMELLMTLKVTTLGTSEGYFVLNTL